MYKTDYVQDYIHGKDVCNTAAEDNKALNMYCLRKVSKMHCSIKEAICKCVYLYIPCLF